VVCDPVWQVTLRSSEMDSQKDLYTPLTSFNLRGSYFQQQKRYSCSPKFQTQNDVLHFMRVSLCVVLQLSRRCWFSRLENSRCVRPSCKFHWFKNCNGTFVRAAVQQCNNQCVKQCIRLLLVDNGNWRCIRKQSEQKWTVYVTEIVPIQTVWGENLPLKINCRMWLQCSVLFSSQRKLKLILVF